MGPLVADLFNLGGYGGFIWSSWGIALVVLAALIGTSIKSMRNRERELARMEAETPRHRRRRATETGTANTPSIANKPGDD